MRAISLLVVLSCLSLPALGAPAAPSMRDALAYQAAHVALADAFREELSDPARLGRVMAAVGRREVALKDVCTRCAARAAEQGLDAEFEPGVWLYEPKSKLKAPSARGLLIAFPPSGPRREWTRVAATTLDGKWQTLDARVAPMSPVLVVRVNGRLSMHKQLAAANERLRAAGLQQEFAPHAAAKGTGHWTTRLESIRLNDDEEPWISGAAEIYAITSGVLTGNQPQVQVVDMPYLDYDGTTYYPRQIILDWASYAYGVANIQLYEHDDNTDYKTLVTTIVSAIGAAGSLAGYPVVSAVTEIANRIINAMPDSWFTNDDDYVDSFYTIEKAYGATRWGARGNALITYIPYELPAN